MRTPADGAPPGAGRGERFGRWFARHRAELDAVVFDIDGVLATGDRPFPAAAALVEKLRADGFPFSFLTNDACNSRAEKARRLNRVGIAAREDEIVSSGDGLAVMVEAENLRGALFFVMGKLGTPCYAEQAGLRTTREVGRVGETRGVVVGEKHYDWERCINAAVSHLARRPDALLLVPNPDDYYMGADGNLELASGSAARLIEHVVAARAGRKPAVRFLGKPHRPIFDCNHRVLERKAGRRIPRKRVIMLGDSLPSDIAGARRFGYRSGLVMTGVTTMAALEKSALRPEFVFRSL